MIKKLQKLLMTLSVFSLFAVPVLVPATALAADDIGGNLQCGADLKLQTSGGCDTDAASTTKLNDIIKLVINLFSLIVGVISVIMIIIGGLKYITSGGDSANVTGAKNTILYAVIGLVVVALAQFIVRFVLAKVSQPTGV